MINDMVPVKEAATMLGISRQAIHDAIRRGALKAMKLSPKAVFVLKSSIDEYKGKKNRA
jgi:predicted DNA-binding transcriptional regulator AlpA